MDDSVRNEAVARHRIPVIDRMMEVLSLLEQRPEGAAIRELVAELTLPRTTVYRILNTLEFHRVVRRAADGSYRLGARLLALASRAVNEGHAYDLTAIALPHMQRLARETGEGCKLSVMDGSALLVIAAVEGKREYALSVAPGQRLPLHAGAAGKLLLASLDKSELDEILKTPLVRYTAKTLTDRKKLVPELARIRRRGWSEEKGEYSPSIRALAAPVRDRAGKAIAALSVPFLAGAAAAHVAKIRIATIASAEAIVADLPDTASVGHLRA